MFDTGIQRAFPEYLPINGGKGSVKKHGEFADRRLAQYKNILGLIENKGFCMLVVCDKLDLIKSRFVIPHRRARLIGHAHIEDAL